MDQLNAKFEDACNYCEKLRLADVTMRNKMFSVINGYETLAVANNVEVFHVQTPKALRLTIKQAVGASGTNDNLPSALLKLFRYFVKDYRSALKKHFRRRGVAVIGGPVIVPAIGLGDGRGLGQGIGRGFAVGRGGRGFAVGRGGRGFAVGRGGRGFAVGRGGGLGLPVGRGGGGGAPVAAGGGRGGQHRRGGGRAH